MRGKGKSRDVIKCRDLLKAQLPLTQHFTTTITSKSSAVITCVIYKHETMVTYYSQTCLCDMFVAAVLKFSGQNRFNCYLDTKKDAITK
jgi:hypothetical protein